MVVLASRRRPAATSQRFSSRSGTTSATVARATRSRCSSSFSGPDQRLRQLVHDARAAQLRERVLGRASRDDRAVGKLVAGPVVVGDDDLQPERPCFGDLGHRSDSAVDRDDEAAFLPRETRERVDRDAVSLLETTREVPVDVCAERAEDGDGERGRADAVGVVVAMDADPLASGNCPANRVTRLGHVSQESGVVSGPLARRERPSPLRGCRSPAGRGRSLSSR